MKNVTASHPGLGKGYLNLDVFLLTKLSKRLTRFIIFSIISLSDISLNDIKEG